MKETILLVDDEQGIRTVMGLSLRDAGYNVITVASGEEALQLFAERPIPIVITDIRMPGMNGLDLLKHIKILAPETEVILISGHADLEMAIQGLKLEASDFITKPIDDDLLHISLKRALERIAMRNKLKEYTSNLEKMINEKSAQLVEAERQLAARQVVDGFAFGLHTLGSSMSGEQQAFNELPCFIAMHDRFMEVLAVNDLYRERSAISWGTRAGSPMSCTATRPCSPWSGPLWRAAARAASRSCATRTARKSPYWCILHRSSITKAKWSSCSN